MSAFVNKQLGTGQRHPTRRTGDHGNLAIELSHEHSIRSLVMILCTPTSVLNVSGGDAERKLMHTDSYPIGLTWLCDGVGEGAAGPPPRQGCARADPWRVATTVPRSRH